MTFGQSHLEAHLPADEFLQCPMCPRRFHPNVNYEGGARRGHPRGYCSKPCCRRAAWLRRTGRLFRNPNLNARSS